MDTNNNDTMDSDNNIETTMCRMGPRPLGMYNILLDEEGTNNKDDAMDFDSMDQNVPETMVCEMGPQPLAMFGILLEDEEEVDYGHWGQESGFNIPINLRRLPKKMADTTQMLVMDGNDTLIFVPYDNPTADGKSYIIYCAQMMTR